MILWTVILFILFIIVAEYTVLKARNTHSFSAEHWADYKSIAHMGRCSQNIARVIPMYQMALDPVQPTNQHFSWTRFFNHGDFKQAPYNIAFEHLDYFG